MPSQMRSTRRICRLVSSRSGFRVHGPVICMLPPAELDALALEDPEESTSYLADVNKAPDFIDELPSELSDVRAVSAVTAMSLTFSSQANSCCSGSCQNNLLKHVPAIFPTQDTLLALILP
jgi:hypothetical protein